MFESVIRVHISVIYLHLIYYLLPIFAEWKFDKRNSDNRK